jgi:hypothetical protein
MAKIITTDGAVKLKLGDVAPDPDAGASVTPSFTYGYNAWSASNPTGSKVDFIRKEIQDYDSVSKAACGDWQLSDQDLQSFIGQNKENLYLAASDAARAMAFRYAKLSTISLGPSSIALDNLSAKYEALADTLYQRGTTRFKPGAPTTGSGSQGGEIFKIGDFDMQRDPAGWF